MGVSFGDLAHVVERRAADLRAALGERPAALVAERDENTCRKEMTPSELLSIGQRLEELERPKAAERQAEGQRLGAEIRWRGDASISADIEASRTANPTNHAVADALGGTASPLRCCVPFCGPRSWVVEGWGGPPGPGWKAL